MRKKLVSKEAEKKKQKRNQYILVGVMVVIMMGSIFGLIAGTTTQNSNSNIKYKGHTLQTNGYFYNMTIGAKTFYFSNNPNDLKINYKIDSMPTPSQLANQPLYLDAVASTPSQEIYQNFYGFSQRIQAACFEGSNCTDNALPVKNCTENMIIIKQSSENRIYTQDKCTFIEGTSQDLNKLTDIFILKLFGL